MARNERRQDDLLRRLIQTIQQEGYIVEGRRSAAGEHALLLRRPPTSAEDGTDEMILVAHELRRHRVRQELHTGEPTAVPSRTIYHYYPRPTGEATRR